MFCYVLYRAPGEMQIAAEPLSVTIQMSSEAGKRLFESGTETSRAVMRQELYAIFKLNMTSHSFPSPQQMEDCLRYPPSYQATDSSDVQRLCNTKLKHQSGTCWHQNLGLGSASLGCPAAGSLPFVIACWRQLQHPSGPDGDGGH
jgi:hypothetical protein